MSIIYMQVVEHLGTRANDLNKQMANNDKDNQLFAKDFANVLKNSKDGDRQNKALKDFMSNPIQKQNLENVLANNGIKIRSHQHYSYY